MVHIKRRINNPQTHDMQDVPTAFCKMAFHVTSKCIQRSWSLRQLTNFIYPSSKYLPVLVCACVCVCFVPHLFPITPPFSPAYQAQLHSHFSVVICSFAQRVRQSSKTELHIPVCLRQLKNYICKASFRSHDL